MQRRASCNDPVAAAYFAHACDDLTSNWRSDEKRVIEAEKRGHLETPL